jgi:hypothetical protein
MGYYVNPRNESKESFLRREGIVAPHIPKTTWESVPKGFLPVTLINNGAFSAAGIAYCAKELETFTRLDDNRPRQLFMVKIEKLIPVAGDDFKQYAISQGWIPAPPKRTTKERIALHMTMQEIVEEMSKDGPFTSINAVAICVDILRYGKSIDLDDLFEGFGTLMTLDTLGIWGDQIRQLHEMCGRNITKLIAVLRAYQLGQAGVTREKLMHAIANNGEGVDLDAAMLAVKERLPRFNNEFGMPTKQDNGSVVLA